LTSRIWWHKALWEKDELVERVRFTGWTVIGFGFFPDGNFFITHDRSLWNKKTVIFQTRSLEMTGERDLIISL
jgi:hypothetical protein